MDNMPKVLRLKRFLTGSVMPVTNRQATVRVILIFFTCFRQITGQRSNHCNKKVYLNVCGLASFS